MRRIAVLPVQCCSAGPARRPFSTAWPSAPAAPPRRCSPISPGSCAANSARGLRPPHRDRPRARSRSGRVCVCFSVRRPRRSGPGPTGPAVRLTPSHCRSGCSMRAAGSAPQSPRLTLLLDLRTRARALATSSPQHGSRHSHATSQIPPRAGHTAPTAAPASLPDGARRSLPDAGDAVHSEAPVVGELRDLIGGCASACAASTRCGPACSTLSRTGKTAISSCSARPRPASPTIRPG